MTLTYYNHENLCKIIASVSLVLNYIGYADDFPLHRGIFLIMLMMLYYRKYPINNLFVHGSKLHSTKADVHAILLYYTLEYLNFFVFMKYPLLIE